jgi:hypothetical protein
MPTNTTSPNYKGFHFPSEIISHAVWLYFRFSLSFRDVEELPAQRRIAVTYETVRQWCLKFGQTYANELRRRRPRCGDKWHLDEVFLTIRGERHYLIPATSKPERMQENIEAGNPSLVGAGGTSVYCAACCSALSIWELREKLGTHDASSQSDDRSCLFSPYHIKVVPAQLVL